GAGDAVVADGKRKRRGVAHVADDPRKARVEHEDADGEAVLVEATAHAPGRHAPYSTPLGATCDIRGEVSRHLALVGGFLLLASLFFGPRIYLDRTLLVGDGSYYVSPRFRASVPAEAYTTSPR